MSEGGPDHLSVQEWKKFEQRTMTDGYREGFSSGKDLKLQKGFDVGYGVSFPVSQFYNKLRGQMAVKSYKSGTNIDANKILMDSEKKVLEFIAISLTRDGVVSDSERPPQDWVELAGELNTIAPYLL